MLFTHSYTGGIHAFLTARAALLFVRKWFFIVSLEEPPHTIPLDVMRVDGGPMVCRC